MPRRHSWRRPCSKLATILTLLTTPLSAHRLDEYLQGAIITIETNHVQAQITLTPGTAILPVLIAQIDTDKNGKISLTEQQAYAKQILTDLALSIDGHHLTPQLRSIQFPTMDDMKEGCGEIQLDLTADLPPGPTKRDLTFDNHHQPGISVYQVNALVPRDPAIRIAKQDRNYTQSHYKLEYEQSAAYSDLPLAPKLAAWVLSVAAILRLSWLLFTSQRRRLAGARTDHLSPS